MTDPQTQFRLETARNGLAGYERAGGRPEDMDVASLSDLANAARWYLEEHGEET